MNDTNTGVTIRAAAPVIEAGITVCSEVMNALHDPADPDQAILTSVPVLAGQVNYGDIVRLGPQDGSGVRPILEVVVASGHMKILAAPAEGEVPELLEELDRHFPTYALQVTIASDSMVALSVHPDFSAERVAAVIGKWLGQDPDREGELPAVAAPRESEPGRIAWA